MSFGIVNPRSFLGELRCVGGLVAGPTLLSAFSPGKADALKRCGLTNRLEIHVPSTVQALRVVKEHLMCAGYSLQHEHDHDDAVEFAGNVLGYQDFGRTVPKILDYDRRLSATASQACTILVNDSPHSALTGVLELPTTLFMIYIEDGSVNPTGRLCVCHSIHCDRQPADWGRRGLRLVKVHYEFSVTVVFGVMFFDIVLDDAFDDALKRSLDRDDDFSIFHGDNPVSFWNATAGDFAGGLKHLHCETYLAREGYTKRT
ncbi:hypothetical protein FA13DRAFT_1791514 [Coprinellus micaceus]|uniref:Uncharacterized protein n=1 Tax=Coprinellus micaceus TaxID=71717 RepID=A0A4Y7TBA5_COPMI|nr:hypothetical protein FA13DRAFT_1791514 [Coprinellus micaceus]